MPNNQQNNLALLRNIRDTGPISSRNSSKGALVQETFNLFRTINYPVSLPEVRHKILVENVVRKPSYQTRRKIWNAIEHRYLSVCPQWIGPALVQATAQGVQSADFLSLTYLYYTLRDRVTFDFVLGRVWEKWQRGVTSIDRTDFLAYLDQVTETAPSLKKWRRSTRLRLAQMSLAALRDFGLLRGKQLKHIQRPVVAPETVYHLLAILYAEGKTGRAIVEAPDWHLFLWTEAEVSNALSELTQKRWIEFERAGQTVILRLVRQPNLKAGDEGAGTGG